MVNPATNPSSPWPALPPPRKVPLVVCPDHPCPYLPGKSATTRAFAASTFPPDLYHQFMNAGFRRSGEVFYQPVCRGCRMCMPIRVPVSTFKPAKSQRRSRTKNQDLTFTIGRPDATAEKWEMYRRYTLARHGPKDEDRQAFEEFLYDSPVETIEICHRDPQGKLLAVGICDISPLSLSTVYFYFDPDESHRGLGTYGALVEIELAQRWKIPHYYLGYWVQGSKTMHYKATFRPCEVLHPDGVWRQLAEQESPGS